MAENRYVCTLSDKLQQKARLELNEPLDNSKRLIEIDKLRERCELKEEKDDMFYLKFLRCAKFDQDYAHDLVVKYHDTVRSSGDIFHKVRNPSLLSKLLEHGPVVPLACRANDGSFVIVGRPAIVNVQSTECTPLDFLASAVLAIEKMLCDEEFQVCGYHLIQDMTGMTFRFAMKMANYGKQFVHVLESLPIHVKSLNVVNEFAFFNMVYNIARLVMKEHTKKLVKLHGKEYHKIHNLVPKEHLPATVGGHVERLESPVWT